MANEVRIIFTADDRSQAQLDALAKRLQGLGQEGERTRTSWDRLATGGSKLFNGIERGYGILTRIDLAQITVQQSAERVRQAQMDYTSALAAFGPGSQQAINAQQQLAAAQGQAEKANMRAKLSFILVAGDVASLALQAPKAVAGLRNIGTALKVATAEATAFQIASGGLVLVAGLLTAAAIGKTAWDSYSASAAKATGVTEQLRQARQDLAALGEQEIRDPVRNLPVAGGLIEGLNDVLPSDFFKSYKEKREELQAAIKDLQERDAAAFRSFNANQEHKKLVATGSEQEIRAALAATMQQLDAYDLKLRTPELSNREAVQAAFDEEGKKAEELAGRLNQIEQAGLQMAQGLVSGLRNVGVSMDKLNVDAQRALMLKVGLDPDAVKSITDARAAEEDLTTKALQSSKALRDQATVTKNKGETTEQFTERLKQMGFTEDDVRTRINATGDALMSQTSATKGSLDSVSDLGNRLRGLGIDLDRLHVNTLSNSLKGDSPLGKLAEEAEGAWVKERELAKTIVQSGNPALLAQLNISARKGETMEELAGSIGLTDDQEQALIASGRLTTEGLMSQKDAADKAAGAMDRLGTSASGAPFGQYATPAAAQQTSATAALLNRGGVDMTPIEAAYRSGAISPQQYQQAVALNTSRAMEAGQQRFGNSGLPFGQFASPYEAQFAAGQSQEMGATGMTYTRTLTGRIDPHAQGGYSQGAQDLYDRAQLYLRDHPDDAAGVRPWLTLLDMTAHGYGHGPGLGSAGLRRSLQLAGIIPAAMGFKGTVDRPTLFLAGEAGRETVNITPRGAAAPPGNATIHLEQHFHGPADPQAVQRAASAGITLTLPQTRVATRRAY